MCSECTGPPPEVSPRASCVAVRLEVAVVHMRTRLVELATTYVSKVHEGELAANLDCARRSFPAQTFPLYHSRRIANRIAYQLPPRAIIRLP